jgi:hypothetical protein
MSTDLEKFIRKNRNDFDDATPSGDVWKNIARTLPVKKTEKRFTLRDIYKWSAAAAIFFVAITSAYFLFISKQTVRDKEIEPTVIKEAPANPSHLDYLNNVGVEYAAEFKEMTTEVQSKQKELKSAIANDPALYRKFQEDLNTLDSSYRMLREQANQSVNGDVIIKAMIQNLQLQSELLGRQLMIIKDFKQTKTSKNEKNI